MTKNCKKITPEKKKFASKTTIYLSLGLHKERPSYRRSLQLSKEAIQVIFALLAPDPDSESGSESTDLMESGSNPDPDMDPNPQPCFLDILFFNSYIL